MATLQATDYADLITTTLNTYGRLQFTDLMSDYRNTIALKRLIRKNKMNFDCGPEVEFSVITGTNGSARAVGLGESDQSNITNVMVRGKMPWRHVTWNWGVEHRTIAMNRSPAKIVDLAQTARISAMGAAIEFFEQRLWKVPSASDTLNIHGIPYYIVKSNTAATYANANGFNGLVPSGYTTVANLNPTTYARWANYATQYTAVTKDDLIRKARRMAEYTKFELLVDDVPDYNTGDDLNYCSNYALVGALEEILESQNENLGHDIASMDGKAMFRRVPVLAIPELDADTTNPLYQINWGEMHAMGLRDWWMKETVLNPQPGQHTVTTTHTDCTLNLLCRNRRRMGVLATDTTMP